MEKRMNSVRYWRDKVHGLQGKLQTWRCMLVLVIVCMGIEFSFDIQLSAKRSVRRWQQMAGRSKFWRLQNGNSMADHLALSSWGRCERKPMQSAIAEETNWRSLSFIRARITMKWGRAGVGTPMRLTVFLGCVWKIKASEIHTLTAWCGQRTELQRSS